MNFVEKVGEEMIAEAWYKSNITFKVENKKLLLFEWIEKINSL